MSDYSAAFKVNEAMGGFTVTFPDFGWGVSQGDDLTQAEDMAHHLLRDLIAHMIRRDEVLPPPRKRSGRNYRTITLPPHEAAKVELYRSLKASGLRKAEFARRLGMPRANVNRLSDLNHSTRFELLEAAFRALGKRLVIHVEDAA